MVRTTLPDAPEQAQATGSTDSQLVGTATITGTVVDTNQDVLQGARVTLSGPTGFRGRSVESGDDGQFAFAGLTPDVYVLTVTAPGMARFTSSQISLRAGEFRIMPPVVLSISAVATSVTVSGNKEELAEQQLRIAEHQRIAGVIPNFYSSYDWNAAPMQAKQKLQLGVRSVLDPVSFLSVASIAGAEQYQNIFPAYGSGLEGYGKRYSAALANHVSGTLLGRAVYPSIFHQDPRYFTKEVAVSGRARSTQSLPQ